MRIRYICATFLMVVGFEDKAIGAFQDIIQLQRSRQIQSYSVPVYNVYQLTSTCFYRLVEMHARLQNTTAVEETLKELTEFCKSLPQQVLLRKGGLIMYAAALAYYEAGRYEMMVDALEQGLDMLAWWNPLYPCTHTARNYGKSF